MANGSLDDLHPDRKPHCRIRNAKPKLQITPKKSNIEEYRLAMHGRVDKLCDSYVGYNAKRPDLAGFSIVIIGHDGSYNATRTIHDDAWFGGKLLPALVAEALRCDTAEELAQEVLMGNFR